MRIVIVTGMSGAGKSTALNNMEDLGYFCVDNLPVLLLDKLADMIQDSSFTYDKVAIGIDIRSGKELDNLSVVLSNIKSSGIEYEILFLDASTENLIRRFKETRREHPLANGTGEIEDAIRKERDRVAFLKDSADYIIDTTGLLTRELKKEINKIFVKGEGYSNIIVSLVSFGYKFGIPVDADIVFDVRFMPNPYYDEQLRPFTGNDDNIKEFVMNSEESHVFIDKLYDLLKFLIPEYVDKEGKHHLTIAIGCTGGRHRSVAVTNIMYDRLSELPFSFRKYHRDISYDKYVKGEI